MLQARDITVAFGEKTILEDVSLDLRGGEILAICGPNGAGKSTLLNVLSGELKPNVGQVTLQGSQLSEWDPGELARTRALLHQQSLLGFPFMVETVVALGRYPHKESAQDEAIITACLEQVGMSELRERKYTTLSGGEKQRVHMARILAQLHDGDGREKLLLLDEPTSALDMQHQESALRIAERLARASSYAVAVVLHDLNLAAAWADRILFLRDGREHSAGPPEEVLTPSNIREIYQIETHIVSHPDTRRPVVIVAR